jgi:prolyl oligopeptidase
MSPGAIHELGLREVHRIRAAMTTLIATLEYQGSLDEFLVTMTSDRRFYYDSEDLLTAYRTIAKRIDPLVVRLSAFPHMPYSVEPVRYEGGPAATYAPSNAIRGGIVNVDVSNPGIRPKFEIIPLMLHEGIPGHHLQMSLARERYATSINGQPVEAHLRASDGFTEGWGLYAERLAIENGWYDDDLPSKLGALQRQLWRARRLVVDTGLHTKGWTRQQAIDYGIEASEIERLGSALLIRQMWFAAWNYWTRTVKGNPPSGTEWWMPLSKAIYAPLGRAVIGGLTLATIATLFFVPAVFALLHRRSHRPEIPA